MSQDDYKVELEVFEGPLDLLLYLIRRDEVDVYDIPIETVTTQYMDYLNMMRMLDLNIAGEFIVMAATLMMIKSRMLLPVDERQDQEDEEEGEDPRWELVRQLVEYKKFKDAAARLQQRELVQENVFGPGGEALVAAPDEPGLVLQDVSLFDLLSAFNEVLKNIGPEEIRVIEAERFTVAEKIDYLLRIVGDGSTVTFASLFRGMPSRTELICTFLAVLELTKLRQITIHQKNRFGDILVTGTPSETSEDAAAVEAETAAAAAAAAEGEQGHA
jgi:segregation and condensation protein A